MTTPQSSDRTPDRWEAEALAERVKDLPRSSDRNQVNPWMIVLTTIWVLLLIVGFSLQSAPHAGAGPVTVILAAGAVALAQIVVLAVRWEPRP